MNTVLFETLLSQSHEQHNITEEKSVLDIWLREALQTC